MWKEKECIGCGALFTPGSFQQKRCKEKCSVKRERDYQKKHADSAIKRARILHEVEFIAVDGEGVTRPKYFIDYDDVTGEEITRRAPDEDVHDYVLLSVGNQSLHKNGKPLDHNDIFAFLWEQYEAHPTAAFVGFALGYDFTMWLKSLSPYAAWSLLTKDGISKRQPSEESAMRFPFPVRDGGRRYTEEGEYVFTTSKWEFDILGFKRFKLRPFVKKEDIPTRVVTHKDGTQEEVRISRPWMYICDVFPFFQSSFLKAIKPDDKKGVKRIVSDAEYERIAAGKEIRSGARFDDEMIEYNLLENEVLARLMTTLNEGFVSDNIRLTKQQWMGPGQAAQEWMKLIGVPTREETEEVVPRWAMEAARKSYYGGWFEIFNHGPVPGTSYAYDINSAYPAVIATLPCLLHGKWSQGNRAAGDKLLRYRPGTYRLVYGEFSGNDWWVGPLPHRTEKGNISHPLKTKGWYWWHEITAAKKAKLLNRMDIEEWVEYDPCKCAPPMADVQTLYEGRLRVGKNSPQGKAKKLVYNSAYGKCAQSIGQPRFSNSIYASLITAGCRTMILDAIATHPTKSASLLMIATDGIVFKEEHPTLGPKSRWNYSSVEEYLSAVKAEKDAKEKPLTRELETLGGWDVEPYYNLSLFMPGLYWHDEARENIRNGQTPQLKSRGVSAKYLGTVIDRVDKLWRNMSDDDEYPFPRVSVRIQWALVGAKQAIVRNAWETCGTNVWNADRELDGNPVNKRSGFTDGEHALGGLRSWPYIQRDNLETLPYEPRFGLEDDEIDPEDLDELVNPDGTFRELRAEAFGMR